MCDEEHFGEQGEMYISEDVDPLSASDESEPEEPPSRKLDHSDDDDDDDDSVPAALHKAKDSFSLSGGCSAFSDRCHSIFDGLDSVDRQTSSSLSQDNIRDILCTQPPLPSRETSDLLSDCPKPPKRRGVPDYLLHPERWTHYSLEDVPETSNRDNSRAALSFLSSLQQERKRDSSCDVQQKMIFSRAKRPMEEQVDDQLSAVRAKERRMHLSHLEEEDEREKTEGSRTEKSGEKSAIKYKDEETDKSLAEDNKQVQNEKKIKESSQGFAYFRNTKAKNYRKSSECSDS